MRYQMNRLRRMAATFELQKEGSLKKHAEAMTLHVFPEGHPQERVVAGVWFVAGFEAQGGSGGIDGAAGGGGGESVSGAYGGEAVSC